MIDFTEYFVICRRHLPSVLQMENTAISNRVGRHTTMRLHSYVSNDNLTTTCLEFDGEYYWRVVLTDKIAPDGIKRMAFIVAGVREDSIKFPKPCNSPARFVNSVLNAQYEFHVRPIRSQGGETP